MSDAAHDLLQAIKLLSDPQAAEKLMAAKKEHDDAKAAADQSMMQVRAAQRDLADQKAEIESAKRELANLSHQTAAASAAHDSNVSLLKAQLSEFHRERQEFTSKLSNVVAREDALKDWDARLRAREEAVETGEAKLRASRELMNQAHALT